MKNIKKRANAIMQEHNIRNINTARQCMMFYNSKIDPDNTPPIEDFSDFLPFPHIWKLNNNENSISLETAKELIRNLHLVPQEIRDFLAEDIQIYKYIAEK